LAILWSLEPREGIWFSGVNKDIFQWFYDSEDEEDTTVKIDRRLILWWKDLTFYLLLGTPWSLLVKNCNAAQRNHRGSFFRIDLVMTHRLGGRN
jgi:hypothetical protein